MSRKRPHLLYVAWGFPPSRGGGVYRALATANAFARAEWRVTVLTAERESFEQYTGTDPTLEDRTDPRIRVVRVPFSWPARQTDVREYSWTRIHSPGMWRRLQAARDQRVFPEVAYGPWRREIVPAALAIHESDPVDLVLCTANPHVTFTVAAALHEQSGVPYVLDYRDAWLLDVFSGTRVHGPASRAAWWERRLMRRASEVWFVNDRIRQWHAHLYPRDRDRFCVVPNGYDDSPVVSDRARGRRADEGLVFGYVGTVTPAVPVAEFVAGWQLALSTCSEMRGARADLVGYAGHYATPDHSFLEIVRTAEALGVRYRGPSGKLSVGDWYSRFDALLLMLGTGHYVTSGKVFEYMATGLPIVSVHDPGNAVVEVLAGYPLWFASADLTPHGLAPALCQAASAARNLDPDVRRRAVEFAGRFQRDIQLAPRVDALTARALESRGPDAA